MTPGDQAQREQALDTTESFLVQAPAGSGKTELLIQRYLALLARVETPEAVVAITFTKKAAAEMAARVIEALRDAAEDEPPDSPHAERTRALALAALEHDRALDWKLLENPSRLEIQTIDALCVRIIGRMPWLARLGAVPSFTEHPEPLYREAARETVRLIQHDEPFASSVAALLVHRDNQVSGVITLIEKMLAQREQWIEWLVSATIRGEETRSALEEAMSALSSSHLEKLDALFPREHREETADLARYSQETCRDMTEFPGTTPASVRHWQGIAEMLMTTNGTWRKTVTAKQGFFSKSPQRNRCLALLNALANEESLGATLSDLPLLPPSGFTDSEWEVLAAALKVMMVAAAQLKIVFRKHGEMDFAELSTSARQALGDPDRPTDLALAFGHRIEHLLLDEFQDTSRGQFELLKRITAGWSEGDGRTLLLVGDPMQSIYRFRQAEVALFEEAKLSGVGGLGLTPLTLTANFRSDTALVSWANGVFQEVMPAKADAQLGSVAFSPSEAFRAESADAGVCLHPFLNDENGAQQAARVLEIVRASQKETIAILVRSRTQLRAIVNLFRDQGISYQAVEIDALAERPVVEDLLSLTIALLHPADRISWLSILRSPWCGLTLADLETLTRDDRKTPVWDLLRGRSGELSADGQSRAKRLIPVLEQALAERGRRGLRSVVENAWRAAGGPLCVESDADLEDAWAFLDLLEKVETGGDLDDFEVLREHVAALFAKPDPRAGERIQVMTIHKAKGLEFDVVILPGLDRQSGGDPNPLIAWTETADGRLLAAAIPETNGEKSGIYGYINKSQRQKEEQEVKRLLYVAATRAKRQLHLLGSVNSKDGTPQNAGRPRSSVFLGILWNSVETEFREKLSSAAPAAVAQGARQPRLLRRVPEGWTIPAFRSPVRWDSVETPAETEEITFDWAGDLLRHAGTVLHAFLQRVAREGLHQWNAQTIARSRSAIRNALANTGVTSVQLDDALQRVESALSRCLNDQRGKWILSNHREAQNEFEISGIVDGRVVEARIDRTFIDENGVRWIVDYKTGSHEGGKIEKFLDNERERYRGQLERYARLLSADDPRTVKLGLYFPLLAAWREWDAPAIFVRTARQASLFE